MTPEDAAGDGIHTDHIRVERSARYALLGEPGPDVRELVVVLHGYRQLAHRFLRRFRDVVAPGRLIAAPEALNRFYIGDAPGRHGPGSRVGATWMTRHDREAEIRDYVAYLDRLAVHLAGDGAGEAVPVRALGFSQGVHTLARWLALGDTVLAEAVFWGEVWPPDLPLKQAGEAFRRTPLISVQGREDGHLDDPLLERQAIQARALGVEVETRWHDGGHELDGALLRRILGRPAGQR